MKRLTLLTLLLVLVTTGKSQTLWTDNSIVASEFGGGNGSDEANAYIIQSPEQLAFLAKQVNNNETYEGKYFRLDADLDLSSHLWEPIGYIIGGDMRPFKGNFNGNGHTIRGLIVNFANNNSIDYLTAGLFGYVGGESQIKKIILESPQITGSLNEGSYTGALIGGVYTTEFGITISDCTITSVNGKGFIKGGKSESNTTTGGLIGEAYGPIHIINCYNACTITGGTANIYSWTGGLIGYTENVNISNCYNSGIIVGGQGNSASITGGLVGHANKSINIINSYCSGNITRGLSNHSSYTGGIIGFSNNTGSGNFYLSNCLVISPSIIGASETHRIIGRYVGEITLTNNYAHVDNGNWIMKGDTEPDGADWDGQMTSQPILSGGSGGWDKNIWIIDPTNRLMPKLNASDPDIINPVKEKTITVNFDTKGGSAIPSQTLTLAQKIIRPFPDPTLEGHIFDGWYKETEYINPWDFDYIINDVSTNLTLYAKWKQEVKPPLPTYHKVVVKLELDDPLLANFVTLNPSEGDYQIEENTDMTLIVFLSDECDESDVKIYANNIEYLPEKNNNLLSVSYTFKIPINKETEIKITGIIRNNAIGISNPAEEKINISTIPGHAIIKMNGSTKGNIRVYTITGKLVKQKYQHDGTASIPLPNGTYLIVADNIVNKIIITD